MIKRILIYDPVPFKGGSKKVMQTILTELPSNIEVWVISNDHQSWRDCNVHFMALFSPLFLQNKTTGALYFLKHFIYLASIISNIYRLKKFTKIIGLSGPGIDFSLYLLTKIIHIDIIQLIQGDIYNSSIAHFCLTSAKQVFYLPSTYASILRALQRYKSSENMPKDKFIAFVNGINGASIKMHVPQEKIGFMWAASLLKWKRLDLFTGAIAKLNNSSAHTNKYFASVCYIKPQADAYLDISNDKQINNISWYADPNNLNEIRAHSSVFISTSEHEPFGLSILEAMFAGLAIVIPADNAYWDQHLTDGYNCLKYSPNNINSLVAVLTRLIKDSNLLCNIAQQAKLTAQQYSHQRCYARIIKSIPI